MPGSTDHHGIGLTRREALRRAATDVVAAWDRYDTDEVEDSRALRRLAQAVAALRAQLTWLT